MAAEDLTGPSVLNFQDSLKASGNFPDTMPRSAGLPRNIGQLLENLEESVSGWMLSDLFLLLDVRTTVGLRFAAIIKIPQAIPTTMSSKITVSTNLILLTHIPQLLEAKNTFFKWC